MFKQLLILIQFIGLSAVLSAQGPINFSASTDARQVILGETFEVYFTLTNANGTEFTPPDFNYFKILSGPSRSISTSNVNGRWSKEETYSFTLQPKTTGKFPIKTSTIKADGRTLKTSSIVIEVLKRKNSTALTQSELDAQIGKQVFIRAVPSVESAKVGEQITLDYIVYTQRDIENYNILTESEYDGFFLQEIRRYNNRSMKEVIDGEQYVTKVLRRVALYPQQAGLLTVDPMEMEIAILMEGEKKKRRSFFYTPAVTRIKVFTDPLKISVGSLPDGAPMSFSGAVGSYKMRADIPRANVSTDDAISLRMEITGNGDVKQVQAPDLNLPTEIFEIYEPKVLDESVFETAGIINGKKIWEYLIIPKKVGQFQIQPAFTFYDVDSSAYVTLKGNNYPIYVRKGQARQSSSIVQKEEELAEQNIRSIKMDTKLRKAKGPFYSSGIFYTFLILPLFLLGGVVVYQQAQNKKANIDINVLKSQRARAQAKKRMTTAEEYMNNNKASGFYDEVSKSLFGYICDKLQIPLAELTKANVKDKLTALNVNASHIDRFMQIINTCEMALFAGKDNSAAMKQTYKDALEVVTDIESEIG